MCKTFNGEFVYGLSYLHWEVAFMYNRIVIIPITRITVHIDVTIVKSTDLLQYYTTSGPFY